MKYEQRNNIGIALMVVGSFLGLGAIFLLSSFLLLVALVGSGLLIGGGFFMMTRGFTELDKDHPDYNRYQLLKKEQDERKR